MRVRSLALLAVALMPSLALADVKFVFIDIGRALGEVEDGKKAQAKLKAEFDRRQQELDEKQEELKKMRDELEKKAKIMKPEALQKDRQVFGERVNDLQQTYQRLQQDLSAKEAAATKPIMDRLHEIIGTLAGREHFSVVLERSSSVIWGQPSLDITNEVIRLYNASPASSGGGKSRGKR